MKTFRKLMAWLLSLAAICTLCIPVSAQTPAAYAELSEISLAPEEAFTCTVTMDTNTVSSLGIEVTCPDALAVTEGQWLQAGLMASFDMSKNKGVFSPGGAKEMEGNIFQLTLKALKPSAEPLVFQVRLIGKNGTQTVIDETLTLSVQINCPGHQFGGYTGLEDHHYRQCALCGYKQADDHTWDAGTVTVPSTCETKGTKVYQCIHCTVTTSETLPFADHTPSDWITDREPAVGVEGSEHIECTVCGEILEENKLPALQPTQNYAARIGETYYTSVEEAMDAAKAGETVFLLKFAEMELLIIRPNITLDLNGQSVSVDFTMGFAGSKVIDSVGGGMLHSPHVQLAKDNPQLPVWDEAKGGYWFFDMVDQQMYSSQEADSFLFVAKPLLGSMANDGLMAQNATNGLTVHLRMRWQTGSGNQVTQLFTMVPDFIAQVYGNPNNIITMRVSGAGAYAGVLQTTVYIESETGVVWSGAELLYRGA